MKRDIFYQFTVVGLSVLLLAACTTVTREGAAKHADHGETGEAATVHWGYTGDEGPANWSDLNPDYVLCKTGETQSPVDVAGVSQVDLANLPFNYEPSPLTILNNGHTIEVKYTEGSYIELDGERYNLEQFHFHSPSEHEIGGKLADLELHLVHKTEDGKIAVVGLLYQVGAENAALAPIWAHLPTANGFEATIEGVDIDAATLLPADRTTFRYSGSLTTPPCSEGVSWLLMTQEQELSADQLAAFQAIYEGNNRPVQPLNGREIQEDVTP